MIRPSDPNLPSVDRMGDEVASYVKMRVDAIKLGLVDSLSSFTGSAIGLILAIVVGAVALMLFSVALLLMVAAWVGSMMWGAVILGGFYLIVAFVLWLLRGKFIDMMVGVFARMFFSKDKD